MILIHYVAIWLQISRSHLATQLSFGFRKAWGPILARWQLVYFEQEQTNRSVTLCQSCCLKTNKVKRNIKPPSFLLKLK